MTFNPSKIEDQQEKSKNKLLDPKSKKKAELRPVITISKYQSKNAVDSWNDLDIINQPNKEHALKLEIDELLG